MSYTIALLSVAWFSFVSCSTLRPKERLLSEEEIRKYNINGILHDAEICPNEFDEQLNKLVVVGPCEIIDCNIVEGKTRCYARAK